jgi:Rrf2 family protein
VKVSAKTEYACIAMLELAARHTRAETVRIRDIADPHGIPSRFLVQILLQLKSAGLVQSTRGASGGYRLARSPGQISLGEVMGVIEGPAAAETEQTSHTSAARVLHRVWNEITAVEQKMLDDLTLQQLVERARQQGEPMYYI